MTETLYLIDGSGFIFRAYHALPPLNRPDGTPVNAVLGFTNMLVRLLKDKHAHHVAVISIRITKPIARRRPRTLCRSSH
jgi:DNA polymerase I